MNPYLDKKLLSKANRKAKKINVIVKPSQRKNKKLDVFKNGKKVASIGHIKYKDFILYSLTDRKLAKKRRELYEKRHRKNIKKRGAGWYAYKILW